MCQRLSFRSNSFPLHKALLEHQPNVVINKIKSSPATNFLVEDVKGFNLLQLAASRGFTEAVLWLLYQGVPVDRCQSESKASLEQITHREKTPFYLALESGHWLVAQILLACGANRNKVQELGRRASRQDILESIQDLRLDPLVVGSVLFWAVKNFNDHLGLRLINLLESQIENKSVPEESKTHVRMSLLSFDEQEKISLAEIEKTLKSLIDFAASQNKLAAATALLRIANKKYNTDTHHVTLGFWSVKYDNENLFKEVADDIPHMVLTLSQLDEYELKKMEENNEIDCFEKYFEKATPDQQRAFLESSHQDDGDQKLSQQQMKIFNKVKFSESTRFKILNKPRSLLDKKVDDDELDSVVIESKEEKEPLLLQRLSLKIVVDDNEELKKRHLKKIIFRCWR